MTSERLRYGFAGAAADLGAAMLKRLHLDESATFMDVMARLDAEVDTAAEYERMNPERRRRLQLHRRLRGEPSWEPDRFDLDDGEAASLGVFPPVSLDDSALMHRAALLALLALLGAREREGRRRRGPSPPDPTPKLILPLVAAANAPSFAA